MNKRRIETARAKKKSRFDVAFSLFGIPFKEVIFLTRRLATLNEAGLSITRSLEILRKQFSSSPMGNLVKGMLQTIEGGGTLATAFGKTPRYFNTFYVSIIKAGEYGGNLEDALRRLAAELEKNERRKKKLVSALVYPIMIGVVAFLVIMIINIFVVPLFRKIYEDANIELPELSQFVLSANEWLLSNGHWIIISFFLLAAFFKMLLKNDEIRYYYHYFLLKVPIFGTIIKKDSLSWFFRSLGTMLNSGIGVIEALSTVSKVVKMEVLIRGISRISREVYEGKKISTAMEKFPYFDSYAVSMVDVGEQSGRLVNMLFSIADSYDEDLDTAYERLEAAFTPVATIVLAVIVGVIVIALFLPYVNYISELASGNMF